MTDPGGVRFEADGPVGHIILDRPRAANAMDLSAALALGEAVSSAEDAAVRSVLITAEGKRFCAGGDVASFASAPDRSSYLLELATVLENHLRRLSFLAKPVVAAVHGAVAGAGLSFVLNADVVVAARSTKFVMAYSSIGLTPDCGVSYLLPRAIGQQRALALALGGRVLNADEAAEWGLVTQVVDDDQVLASASELAHRLAGGPGEALAATKRLIRGTWEETRASSAEEEARTIAHMVSTDEATRLIDTFIGR